MSLTVGSFFSSHPQTTYYLRINKKKKKLNSILYNMLIITIKGYKKEVA